VALPALIGVAMSLLFVVGRMSGPEGLTQIGGYKTTLSLHEYVAKTGQYLDPLFYANNWFTIGKTAVLLLLLVGVAAALGSRVLGVCAGLFMIGILPVAFIPLRSVQAALIPIAGLAIFAATLLNSARRRLAGRWQTASAAVIFAAAFLFMLKVHPDTGSSWEAWQTEYTLIRNVRQQMAQLHPRMPKGGKMLIVTDPFGHFDWASLFIGRLLYRDGTLAVDRVAKLNPKPGPAEIARYDVIMTWQDGKLIDLKPDQVRIAP
jgi:hypothetical protein